MRHLSVYIEINGEQIRVGSIDGRIPEDAVFSYDESYLEGDAAAPISIKLPLQKESFSSAKTRNFFDGLLPEGYTRRCAAEFMKIDENDYLSMLAGLGSECIGAVMVIEGNCLPSEPAYVKLSSEEMRTLAAEGAAESVQIIINSHLSLTGASGKAGLYYDAAAGQWYQPVGIAPSTHIVKQSHIRLDNIVTNELLCMLTAEKLGIETPQSFIIGVGDGVDDGKVLFASKRYDRVFSKNPGIIDGLPVPNRLHQEDFSQAMGLPASAKYEHSNEGYLRRMFSLLRAYSADPIIDQMKLWEICVFNYLIGNTDAHIKNFSLLYGSNLKAARLAPAYDIISTVIYGSSTRDMAFAIDGKYRIDGISRQNFKREAHNVGLGTRPALKSFDKLVSGFETAINEASDILMEQGFNNVSGIRQRILEAAGIRFV